MAWLRRARALAGLAAVLVLLGLFVVETVGAGSIEPGRVRTLLALIAALLGVDLAGTKMPLTFTVESGDSGAEPTETTETNEKD
jgi:O-antigen ligase